MPKVSSSHFRVRVFDGSFDLGVCFSSLSTRGHFEVATSLVRPPFFSRPRAPRPLLPASIPLSSLRDPLRAGSKRLPFLHSEAAEWDAREGVNRLGMS